MTQKVPQVGSFALDRTCYYPLDTDGVAIGMSKALTAAKYFIIKIDLNGTSAINFHIGEEGGANDIAGFNLTVNFYEGTGKLVTGSAQTVAVPITTKATNQKVAITGETYIETADYCTITGTVPYTAAITVSLFAKGIYDTAIDDISSVITTLNATCKDISSAVATMNLSTKDVSSAVATLNLTCKDVSSAIATMNSNLSSVVYVDGADFTFSASKTLASGGIVNPDARTAVTGDIIPLALDVTGQVRGADFDAVNVASRVEELNPKRLNIKPLNSLLTLAATTAAASTYVDMFGYDSLTLESVLGGGSYGLTAEVSILDDGATVDSACPYADVTTLVYGTAATTIDTAVALNKMFIDSGGIFGHSKYVRLTATPTASTTLTLHGRLKEM